MRAKRDDHAEVGLQANGHPLLEADAARKRRIRDMVSWAREAARDPLGALSPGSGGLSDRAAAARVARYRRALRAVADENVKSRVVVVGGGAGGLLLSGVAGAAAAAVPVKGEQGGVGGVAVVAATAAAAASAVKG